MNIFSSKAVLACAAIVGFVTSSAEAAITGFDDIIYWVGSGANQAAMVIDWNDGTETQSFAWGYRWDGEATGRDMFQAIAGFITDIDDEPVSEGADASLTAVYQFFSFGPSVTAITYDDGGTEHSEDGFGPDSTGYWGYWIFGGDFEYSLWPSGTATYDVAGSSSYAAVDWTYSPTGFAARPLINGSWDGWSWSANFVDSAPGAPVAVPEPATWVLFVSAGVCGLIVRRAAYARGRVQPD